MEKGKRSAKRLIKGFVEDFNFSINNFFCLLQVTHCFPLVAGKWKKNNDVKNIGIETFPFESFELIISSITKRSVIELKQDLKKIKIKKTENSKFCFKN